MPRKVASPRRIQEEIGAIVNADPDFAADNLILRIGPPQKHEEDETGCNWNVDYVPNHPGHMGLILNAIAQVRANFNLP
ncbi:MAG TPA: hypothetical protein PKA20_05680 [Burkholderiaceae bacterium]|nr:hypothetical protein [Burkholderiaceae bacterium]